jgi:hypothetical protein
MILHITPLRAFQQYQKCNEEPLCLGGSRCDHKTKQTLILIYLTIFSFLGDAVTFSFPKMGFIFLQKISLFSHKNFSFWNQYYHFTSVYFSLQTIFTWMKLCHFENNVYEKRRYWSRPKISLIKIWHLGSYCIRSYSPSMVDEDLIQSGLPRTILVHCIHNGRSLSIQSLKSLFGSLCSQWSFPVTRNNHWKHNEQKRFDLRIYLYFLSIGDYWVSRPR